MGSYYTVETIKRHTHDEQSAAEEGGEQDGHGHGAVPERSRRNVHIAKYVTKPANKNK